MRVKDDMSMPGVAACRTVCTDWMCVCVTVCVVYSTVFWPIVRLYKPGCSTAANDYML